jgi:hypothetical protein
MQRSHKQYFIALTGIALVIGVVLACNGGDDAYEIETSRTSIYVGTQNPGDVWSWTLTMDGSIGSFSATNETLGYDYSGDVGILPNDFLRLTVTAATEPGATLPAVAYAYEVPYMALFVKPEGDDPVVVCTAQGACPTLDATYNWVTLVNGTFDADSDTVYGVTDMTGSEGDLAFDNRFYLLNGSANGTRSGAGFSCSSGRITKSGEPMTFAVTPSGLLIGDQGPGAGGFAGMQAPDPAIDLDDLLAFGREFRGVVIKAGGSGEDSEPVWARVDGLGAMIGGYDDFEAGIESGDSSEIAFLAQNSPGVFSATLTDASGSRPLIIMVSLIDGHYVLYGAGTGEPPAVAQNFLAIEHFAPLCGDAMLPCK